MKVNILEVASIMMCPVRLVQKIPIQEGYSYEDILLLKDLLLKDKEYLAFFATREDRLSPSSYVLQLADKLSYSSKGYGILEVKMKETFVKPYRGRYYVEVYGLLEDEAAKIYEGTKVYKQGKSRAFYCQNGHIVNNKKFACPVCFYNKYLKRRV